MLPCSPASRGEHQRLPYIGGAELAVILDAAITGGQLTVIEAVPRECLNLLRAVSALSARATLRADRPAAVDQRLWEKRSDVYKQLLDFTLRYERDDMPVPGPEAIRESVEALDEMESLVYAYATDVVLSWYRNVRSPGLPPAKPLGDRATRRGTMRTAAGYEWLDDLRLLRKAIREEFQGRQSEHYWSVRRRKFQVVAEHIRAARSMRRRIEKERRHQVSVDIGQP